MIFLVLILGLILRLISLNQSLWLDEATTALVSKMSLGDIFTKFLPGDFHPPFYYLILKYWVILFGNSEILLRVPSIIFGVLTIYIVYLIGQKIFNKNTGLVSALFMAASGLAVYYSQEARMYSLATLLVSLLVYFFVSKKWLLFAIVLLALGATDYVALLIIPIFWLIDTKVWKKLILAHIPLILGFLIWLPIFTRQISGGLSLQNSNWWNLLGTPTFKNMLLIPVKFILGRISFDNKVEYAAIVATVSLFYCYLIYNARRASRLIWAWLILPIVLGIVLSFKIPTLSYFRFLFCLPAFYLLIAYGVEKTGKYKNLLVGLILIINLLTTGYYLLNPRFQREDWRAAATAIGNEKIVFPADSQKEALIYYGKGGQIIDFVNFKGGVREIWLSRYVWEIFDQTDSARTRLEKLGYNKISESDFNGVVFWKYESRN